MFVIKITDSFSGAHNLRGYEGKCENLHGHNWKVELEVSSKELDETGMVVDFKDVKKYLSEVLSEFDHKYLNDISFFIDNNPTSENIAKYIYDSLSKAVKGLSKVSVWETDTSQASYLGER